MGLGGKDIWRFYWSVMGKWRWDRLSPKGEVVAASTEGFDTKAACQANAKRSGWPGE